MIEKPKSTLEETYDDLIELRDQINTALNILKNTAITEGCPHTRIHTYIEDADNGYGQWWKVKRAYCLICGKDNL